MPTDPPSDESEPELPPYIIEGARSSRSRCKTCRRSIEMGALRLGVLVEGPYGAGHMWHHLHCAARKMYDKVEEAYSKEAWSFAKKPPEVDSLPTLEELSKLRDEAEQKKSEKKELPYAELAPSGRARCKHCDELIEKAAPRVVLGREVQFGQQLRTTPINVHPACVADALRAEDCATEIDGFAPALRKNSKGLESEVMDGILEEVGELL
jgi:hypothetical protein